MCVRVKVWAFRALIPIVYYFCLFFFRAVNTTVWSSSTFLPQPYVLLCFARFIEQVVYLCIVRVRSRHSHTDFSSKFFFLLNFFTVRKFLHLLNFFSLRIFGWNFLFSWFVLIIVWTDHFVTFEFLVYRDYIAFLWYICVNNIVSIYIINNIHTHTKFIYNPLREFSGFVWI